MVTGVFTSLWTSINFDHDWIFDSGCSNHLTGSKDSLDSVHEYSGSDIIVTADDSLYPIESIRGLSLTSSCGSSLSISDVYYVSGMKKNLIFIF